MKYGLAYLPTVGRLNTFLENFYRNMKCTQLSQVSKIEMSFDPFTGKDTESIRLFAYHVDTKKIRQTNFKCAVKLNVVCDRTEPNMRITFTNGDNALFKTKHLTALEIAEEFNTLCGIYEQKAAEEESKKRRR